MERPTNLAAAVDMAREFMRDDPETFKQGYTLENAAIAVSDVFGFSRSELERALRRAVGRQRARIAAAAYAVLETLYPCADCGARAGAPCRPEYGCELRSRQPAR